MTLKARKVPGTEETLSDSQPPRPAVLRDIQLSSLAFVPGKFMVC